MREPTVPPLATPRRPQPQQPLVPNTPPKRARPLEAAPMLSRRRFHRPRANRLREATPKLVPDAYRATSATTRTPKASHKPRRAATRRSTCPGTASALARMGRSGIPQRISGFSLEGTPLEGPWPLRGLCEPGRRGAGRRPARPRVRQGGAMPARRAGAGSRRGC